MDETLKMIADTLWPEGEWTISETLEGLRYIASSPEHGGFHQNAIDTAKAALMWFERLGVERGET